MKRFQKSICMILLLLTMLSPFTVFGTSLASSQHWAAAELSIAAENQWFDDLQPEDVITREILISALAKAVNAEIPQITSAPFSDITVDNPYSSSMTWAKNEGIIFGENSGFVYPQRAVTREETAVILTRYIQLEFPDAQPTDTISPFADAENISDWAKESVDFLKNFGLLLGKEDNRMEPQETLTCAECAVLLCRLNNWIETRASNIATITIVHTNDMHGYASRVTDENGIPTAIGFAALKTLIDEQNADLVLDAGDTFHGQAFATLDQGSSIAELLSSTSFDAITAGNHDWNYGAERLKTLGEKSNTPILAGNVIDSNGDAFFPQNEIIKEVDGIKIGVFGVIDPDLYSSIAKTAVEGVQFGNDVEYANAAAERLRNKEGCDIVIALSHQIDCPSFVQQTHGIDLLIAGHEHVIMQEDLPDADGKIVRTVEAGYYFQNVGIVRISYNKTTNQMTDISSSVLPAEETAQINENTEILEILEQINQRQESILSEKIGISSETLPYSWEEIRCDEQPLGRLITSAYLYSVDADVAIENAGGIRSGIPLGDITRKDIISISPFGNYLITKKISGEDLLTVLETSVEIGLADRAVYDQQLEAVENGEDPYQYTWPEHSGSYLQFGGITAEIDAEKPTGSRITNVKIGEDPLVLSAEYTIVMNSYTASDPRYPELANAPIFEEYGACEEILIHYIRETDAETRSKIASTVGLSFK